MNIPDEVIERAFGNEWPAKPSVSQWFAANLIAEWARKEALRETRAGLAAERGALRAANGRINELESEVHDARKEALREAANELDSISLLWFERSTIPRADLIEWLRALAEGDD